MRAYERLIQYVRIHTASSEEVPYRVPSTERQFDLGRLLVQQMQELGVTDARIDEHCYVYGSLPATPGYAQAKKLGFIAHMDTIPDFSGENVQPTLVEKYAGGDIPLGSSGRVLSPKDFPSLDRMIGRTLIVTDGSTVLGGDDKAGVAEIMTLIERLQKENLPHGPLGFAFTPDEEIGQGTDFFDVHAFGCDFAYTLDGREEGEIEFENFNAASATVLVQGLNIHPGSAKNVMVNAATVAMDFHALLPEDEVPEKTEGYEGFFHLCGMSGTVDELLMAAEYIMSEGNDNVILCERGIRTFETRTRNTFDLNAVPVLHHLSHLPVVADPSHATGYTRYVEPMALAATACGANGLEIEVHDDPSHAWSDGAQALTPDQFDDTMRRIRAIREVVCQETVQE